MSGSRDVCRTCLREDNLSPIFTRADQSAKYTIALFLTTGLQIELNDGLPQKICCDCRELVSASIHFREQGHESEQALLSWGFTRRTVNTHHNEIFKQFYLSLNGNPESEEKKDVVLQNLKKEPADYSDPAVVPVEYEKVPSNSNIKTEVEPKTENEHAGQISDGECNDFGETDAATHSVANEASSQVGTSKKSNERSWSDDSFEFEQPEKEKRNRRKRPFVLKTKAYFKEELEKMYGHLIDQPVQGPGPFTCKECNRTLKSWGSFTNHAKIHVGKGIICEFCGIQLISHSNLQRHLMSYHGRARPHKCIHCDYTAVDSTRLMMHVRRHTNERPYVCDTCGAGFVNRSSIMQHLSTHLTERPYTCPQCPSTFKSKTDVSIHIVHVHKKKEKTQCSICHKYRRDMREHMLNIHDIVLPPSKIGPLRQRKRFLKKKQKRETEYNVKLENIDESEQYVGTQVGYNYQQLYRQH